MEFSAVVIEEDGTKVEKLFTTVSNRLKKELRTVLEDQDLRTGPIKLSIMKVGDKFNTQYAVELVKE